MEILVLGAIALIVMHFYSKESSTVTYGENKLTELRSKFMINMDDIEGCRNIRDEASKAAYYIHNNIGTIRQIGTKKIRDELEGFALDMSIHIGKLEKKQAR